jgi:RecA-family ATPase
MPEIPNNQPKKPNRGKYYGSEYSEHGMHELPDRTVEYLKFGAGEGTRNEELAEACRQVRDSGRAGARWEGILLQRAAQDGLSENEIRATIKSCMDPADKREACGPIYVAPGMPGDGRKRRQYALKPAGPPPIAALPDPVELYPAELQGHQGLVRWLQTAFLEGEQVSISPFVEEIEGPHEGVSLRREEWIDKLEKRNLERGEAHTGIPSLFGCKKGVYVRLNPMDGQGAGDRNVTSMRHVLVEFDEGTKEAQLDAFLRSKLPITCIVDSGSDGAGKGLHAWVRVDAATREEYNERRERVWETFDGESIRIDRKVKNPSRYSRIPTGIRGEGIQRLVRLQVGAANWEEWCESDHAVSAEVQAILSNPMNIVDLSKMEIDESQTLLGDRFLCRGSFMLFVGPTGKGKSSAVVQQDAYWALGRSAFDIKPNGPLKIATLQSENDQGDLTEMSRGSMNGLKTLDPKGLTNEDIQQIANNTRIHHVIESGDIVWDAAEALARGSNGWKPDIIRLDPLQAMAGLDFVKDTRELLAMINRINYITHKYGVAFVFNHHTTKLTFEDIDKRGLTYAAYMSAGGAQLINAARCQLALLPIGDDMPRAFSLIASKRERRLPDWDGRPERFFMQSEHGIRWEDPTDDELEEIARLRNSKGQRGQKTQKEREIERVARDMERQQKAKKAAEEKAQKEAEKATQREAAIEIVRAEVRQKMQAGEKVSVADAAEIARKIPHAPRTTNLISGLYIKPARTQIEAETEKNEADSA